MLQLIKAKIYDKPPPPPKKKNLKTERKRNYPAVSIIIKTSFKKINNISLEKLLHGISPPLYCFNSSLRHLYHRLATSSIKQTKLIITKLLLIITIIINQSSKTQHFNYKLKQHSRPGPAGFQTNHLEQNLLFNNRPNMLMFVYESQPSS